VYKSIQRGEDRISSKRRVLLRERHDRYFTGDGLTILALILFLVP